MTKRYLGAHSVHYQGTFNGGDRMWGTWKIGSWDSGPWGITFREAKEKTEKKQITEVVVVKA
ncbi:MAG: hypothetical protein AAGI38_18005 [Bacteroidota bacterium]